MASLESFKAWRLKARRGDRFTYYVGNLAVDRGSGSRDMRSPAQEMVTRLAEGVRGFQTRGVVSLTQARLSDDGSFVYYATKR